MRAALGAVAAVLAGLALFQITMQPSGAERAELAAIFAAMAVVALAAAWFLPAFAKRSKHIVTTLFALSLVTVGVAVIGLLVTARRMFVSDHDATLLLVVLGFGLIAAFGFAVSASSSLTNDLRRMATTAHDVAAGDLSARTGVRRADEVGDLARDLDAMAGRLEEAAREREAIEKKRRVFFAAIGHDLRTPLASLQAAAEALRDGVAVDPDRYHQSIEADLAALNSLVEDLFLLARLDAGDVEIERVATDLAEVADEAIEVIRPVAVRSDVEVALAVSERVVVTTGPEAVSRILRNLLDNAVRHSPPGSKVTVAVDSDTRPTIAVVDEGPGFDATFVDKAFESFSRPDGARSRESGGAGLGLAIARGLVEALDGEIWADTGPGGRVTFTLP